MIELAVAQRQLGHEPSIWLGQAGEVAEAALSRGLRVVNLRWPARYVSIPQRSSRWRAVWTTPSAVLAAIRLRAALRREHPDVLQVHTRKAQLVSSLGLIGSGVPLLWHLRDDPPRRHALRLAVRACARRTDHLVAISEWLIRAYSDLGALGRSRRIGLVPSGIKVSDLERLPTPWLDGNREPVVGMVGQVARRKGQDRFVAAAGLLAHRYRARFAIIGRVEFPEAERLYGRALALQIEASAVRDRIDWMTPTVEPSEAFDAIDILVQPSVEPEPLGRVMLEAMASRRPIVAVDLGAASDLLDPTVAVLVDVAEPDRLADAIASLLNEPDHARRLAAAAQSRAHLFDAAFVAQLMEAEYALMGLGSGQP